MLRFIFILLLPVFCLSFLPANNSVPVFNASMRSVSDVPLPAGFERVSIAAGSFAAYLRQLPLKKNKTIYLYNGQPKQNQSLHYAVIDISTGNKDLQQCADAVMRLRGEYFYERKMYDSIRFPKVNHAVYQYAAYLRNNITDTHQNFLQFMETVFINCGTYTLEESLKSIARFSSMQPGDVFVKGGAPGHAEIVVDLAINKTTGKKIYLLAEGYMPAQDIHIVLNPTNPDLGPWYELTDSAQVVTPTWVFDKSQLRRW